MYAVRHMNIQITAKPQSKLIQRHCYRKREETKDNFKAVVRIESATMEHDFDAKPPAEL